MINKHEENYSQRCIEYAVSLPNKKIHSDIQTAHYRAQFLLMPSQVKSTGINRAGKCTNLTKNLPGFGLIKEPHNDPGILALRQNMKTKQHIA